MIRIDGAIGSGGGQILRSSAGLSALTGKPFKIINIRKGRCNKGMQEQHVQAISAVASLCDAETKGLKKGSEELEFIPGKIKSGTLDIKIKTAGSVGLLLQALMIPAIKTDVVFDIKGGATFGKWASPVLFLDKILKFYLEKMSYSFTIDVKKEGFFPKGGARVTVHSEKAKLKPLNITEHGQVVYVGGLSKASKSLKSKRVAERQKEEAGKLLDSKFPIDSKIDEMYVDSLCPGTGMQLWVESENSVVGGNSFGEKKKSAENVGIEAAKMLIREYEKGVIPSNAADQLIPYMALAPGSKIKTSKITNHIRTNIDTVEKFLDVKFEINGRVIRSI